VNTIAKLQLHDLTITHDAAGGTVSLARGDGKISALRASAVLVVDGVETTVDLLAGASSTLTARAGRRTFALVRGGVGFATRWSLSVAADDPWLDIQVAVTAGENAVEIREIRAIDAAWAGTHLAGETAAARWWVTPASAWDPPGTRPLSGPVHDDDTRALAYDLACAFAPSGRALTIGHVLPTRWGNRIEADATGVRVISALRVPVAAHASLLSDACLIDVQRPVLTTVADIARKCRGRRTVAEAREHSGWSTWDFFTDKIVEADVHTALAAIKARPKIAKKLRYIVVDDFWQEKTGDWNPGKRFGSIENTAKAIADAGFLPGIWTAPFFADRDSELLRDHPDYAMRLDDGRLYAHCMGCDPPWGDRIFLDPTHPGVREHLGQLYRKLYGWGFRYFKTDFLADPIAHEFDGDRMKWRGKLIFHDPRIGLVRGHRACMETIRAAIGPDSFWLGCGSLFASGAGVMDATRISGDLRVHYPNLLICARSAIFNTNLHGGPFLADPDFSVFRGRDTAIMPIGLEVAPEGKKPYDRLKGDSGPVFDLAEARLWAAILILSGGLVMLSDRIDGLNAEGIRIVETLLELSGGEPAVPGDLFTPMPTVWTTVRDGKPLALVANWADTAGKVQIPAGTMIADGTAMLEVWSGKAFTWKAGAEVALPAHGHLLLRLR
jgi:hypothetical protein